MGNATVPGDDAETAAAAKQRPVQPGWKTGRSGGVTVQIAYRISRARPSTQTTVGGTVIWFDSRTRRCSHCPPVTTCTNEVMSAHKIGPVPGAPV